MLKNFLITDIFFFYRSAYAADCISWGISVDYCYTTGQKALLFWNSPIVFLYINKELTLSDIIFDGSGLLKAYSSSNTCTSKFTSCCTSDDAGTLTDECSEEAKNFAFDMDTLFSSNLGVVFLHHPKGIFNFEFWPDLKFPKAPSLLIQVI